MAVGLSSTTMDNILNTFRGTTYTAPAGVFVQVHVGDPGAAGTANPSAVTSRQSATFAAPTTDGTGRAINLSNTPTFSMTATETISHISLWSATSAGTFLQSAALTSSVPVINGSTLTFSQLRLKYDPVAA